LWWRQSTGWTICDEDGLEDEPFMMKSLQNELFAMKSLQHRNKPLTISEKPIGVAWLLYQHFTSNTISRLLATHNIKNINIPTKKKILSHSDWSRGI
jgi:hypothetical protein